MIWPFSGISWRSRATKRTLRQQKPCRLSPRISRVGGGLRISASLQKRDAEAIGAAWARQFAPGEQPAFYVDGRTPEVTIGVSEAARGQGVGGRLLRAVTAEAARRRPVPECPA